MHKIYCSISLSLNDFLNNRGKNAREKCWQSFMTHSVSFSSFLSSYRISYSLREVKISFRVHCTITHQTSPLNIFPRQNNPKTILSKLKRAFISTGSTGPLQKQSYIIFRPSKSSHILNIQLLSQELFHTGEMCRQQWKFEHLRRRSARTHVLMGSVQWDYTAGRNGSYAGGTEGRFSPCNGLPYVPACAERQKPSITLVETPSLPPLLIFAEKPTRWDTRCS